MPEYRYLGVNVAGKPIQGVLFGTDTKAVKNRIKKLVDKKGMRLDAIQKKTKFTYKVQKSGQKPIVGEQKAFAKEELENALMKMGYRVEGTYSNAAVHEVFGRQAEQDRFGPQQPLIVAGGNRSRNQLGEAVFS